MTTQVYTPFLLTPTESNLVVFFRSYASTTTSQRGSPSPFDDAIGVGDLATVAVSPEITALLNTLIAKVDSMSETFDTELTQLKQDVAAQGTVISSATTAFQGLVAKLLAAEGKAKEAGATDDQIAAVAAVRMGLENNTALLAAAIPANTTASAGVTTNSATNAPSGVVVDTTTGTTTTMGTGPGTGTGTGTGPGSVIPGTNILTGTADKAAPNTAVTGVDATTGTVTGISAPPPPPPLTATTVIGDQPPSPEQDASPEQKAS